MVRSEVEYQAYVIDIIQQKEADAIITFLSEDGMKTAYIHGMMKIKSRYYFLNNRFLKVKISGVDTKNYFKIKDAKLINYPQRQLENYQLYCEIISISKVMNQVPNVLDYASFYIFDFLITNVNLSIIKHFKQLMLVHLCQNLGIEFTVDKCAKCGRNNQIINFNLYEGGMLCCNCNESFNKLNLEELRAINEVYTLQISKTIKREFNQKNYLSLIDFLNNGYGLNIRWE